MNRRRILVALAILVPLAIFGAAKWATRFRPVRVGVLPKQPRYLPVLRASDRYVVAGDRTIYSCFDLQTGARTTLQNQGIAPVGAWMVRRTGDVTGRWQLELTAPNGATRAYGCGDVGFNIAPSSGARPNWQVENLAIQRLRVSTANNRLELLDGYHYLRWNLTSGALERQTALQQSDPLENADDRDAESFALTRDGKRALAPVEKTLVWRSTRNGEVLVRVPLRGVTSFRTVRVSPFGTFALYSVDMTGSVARWRVVDAQTGRALWSFDLFSDDDFAPFAPDETRIALPLRYPPRWEIRDLATGQLLRTLPLAHGAGSEANLGAFSPDGATLYSVAGGVLYRQRAR